MKPLKLILTSVNQQENALNIAGILLKEKLAACVQIMPPGTSMYLWKGQLQQEQEYYIQVKTDADHVEHVIDCLTKYHPYELPEIIILDAKASTDYHCWLSHTLQA